jgi:hypothetical protein
MTVSAKVENNLRWQVVSASRFWSPAAGSAGRRRGASFSVGLARSFAQWDSAGRARAADRVIAASGDNSVIGVALGPGGSTRRCSPRGLRRHRRAGQLKKVSRVGQRRGGRRRGRLGREAAVSLPRDLIAWR